MSGVKHLSMRVPWRDRPWDQFICTDPLANSSCTLLANIGPKRDDSYERDNASASIAGLNQDRLPCLIERATFMSPIGYTVTKTHPYAWHQALGLQPTPVSLPGYAFEAVPFRWLNRSSLKDEIGHSRVPRFNQGAEDAADTELNFSNANWVMDGDNQRAVIDTFFEPVAEGDSLVFIYLKHSPLQEQRTDRLLVGAARITQVQLPPLWRSTGRPPFTSSMWETIVEHSLRTDMRDGILLPYQSLVPLMDDGVDVDAALAWAPEGRAVEFSYVTEHLSDDAAIEALGSLQRAAEGMREFGLEIPDAALEWVARHTERLWRMRGPIPGIAAVLEFLGVQHADAAARAVLSEAGESDPWAVLDGAFGNPAAAPESFKAHLPGPIARIWNKLPVDRQMVLRLLSAFDISTAQVTLLMDGATEPAMSPEELLENPYYASTCTYGLDRHVPFVTVDRALFPPSHVAWTPPIPPQVRLEGHLDRRRIEALLTDVAERQGAQGDTVVPEAEAIERANALVLTQPPNLNMTILSGLELDHDSLSDWENWSPLTSIRLAEDSAAYKLTRFEQTSALIREWINTQQAKPTLGEIPNARTVLDEALQRNRRVVTDASAAGVDELEERARAEKAAGLSALHNAPLSVLIGGAGTGKTTLLRALVEYPGVDDGDVLLLAPTGKARVQDPVTLEIRGKSLRFDRRLLHVSASGIPMASKNEVIVASLLDRLVPGQWEYERILQGKDGREVLPDFTIDTSDGRKVFWEHAGMLDLPDYAEKWQLKKQWYIDNGILPFDRSPQGGPNGVLMWTDDRNGADAAAWLAYAAKVFGVEPTTAPADGGPPQRRVVKKALPKRLSRNGND